MRTETRRGFLKSLGIVAVSTLPFMAMARQDTTGKNTPSSTNLDRFGPLNIPLNDPNPAPYNRADGTINCKADLSRYPAETEWIALIPRSNNTASVEVIAYLTDINGKMVGNSITVKNGEVSGSTPGIAIIGDQTQQLLYFKRSENPEATGVAYRFKIAGFPNGRGVPTLQEVLKLQWEMGRQAKIYGTDWELTSDVIIRAEKDNNLSAVVNGKSYTFGEAKAEANKLTEDGKLGELFADQWIKSYLNQHAKINNSVDGAPNLQGTNRKMTISDVFNAESIAIGQCQAKDVEYIAFMRGFGYSATENHVYLFTENVQYNGNNLRSHGNVKVISEDGRNVFFVDPTLAVPPNSAPYCIPSLGEKRGQSVINGRYFEVTMNEMLGGVIPTIGNRRGRVTQQGLNLIPMRPDVKNGIVGFHPTMSAGFTFDRK